MNKPVIIIIDDIEFYLELIKEYCSNIQANIVTFMNPTEALEYAKENVCDIAIIDYLMPDINGIELTKKLKAVTPDIFIIMITATTNTPSLILEALENGASEFLNKPLYMAEFIARIKNALEIVNSRNIIRSWAEEEIVKSEKKLKALFEILPIGIVLTDVNKHLVEVNPELEKILSFSKDEMLDKKYMELTYFDIAGNRLTIEQLSDIISQSKNRTIKDFEIEIKKENRELWINISASPMPINGYGVVITVSDITKQKKLEMDLSHSKEAAEAATRVKSDFIKNISHKMITPLFHICGYIDFLYEKHLGDELHEMLRLMKIDSQNLMEMLNNVLDYSRIDADVEVENRSSINLSRMIKELEKVYRKFAEEKGLEFTVTIDTTLQEDIKLDKTKIKKILKILISNAVKFTHQGSITISIDKETVANEEHLVFIIKDTGVGISKNKIRNLYGVFEQDNYFSVENNHGIGIGLAVAKRMIELLHGTIDINSYIQPDHVNPLGNIPNPLSSAGTTVTVKIPLETASEPVPTLNNTANSLIKRELNILIAEKNETTIYLLKKLLSKVAKQINVSVNGNEILQKIRENSYDLILMNICTPDISGLEITRILRREGSAIPIIAITPCNSIERMQEGLEAGMNDYISSPFEFETLINTIERVIK